MLTAAAAGWAATPAQIANYLEQLDAGAQPSIGGRLLRSSAAVSEFYRAHQHAPIWTNGPARRDRLAELRAEIRASADHGLAPEHYHLTELGEHAEDTLTTELLATDAFLTQAEHRMAGALSPSELDPEWYLPQSEVPAGEVLASAVRDDTIARTLAGLWPQHGEYALLLARRQRVAALERSSDTLVAPGPILKYGQSSPRVVLLKERLIGPGGHTPEFDHDLREAVLAFQASVGLVADGIVGDATIEMLNTAPSFWLDTLDANLERWRWLPNELPRDYLSVNIAAFELRAIDAGREVVRMKVIVGQPYRRTPMFTQTLKYLVYNPEWNIPFEIAVKDKLPVLKRDPVRLALQGYEARLAGTEFFVPVDTVDWRRVTRDTFHYDLRQLPGPTNALGRIKFMLPNRFAVYLHDTPDRGLFDRQQRDFSSGCIRLADPVRLADWVLRHDGQPNAAASMPDQLASGATRTVHLQTPLPVLIVYFTAFVGEAGDVMFRRDLYQRDQAIISALRSQ
ncbi:MAG TPA: L,D-transpeptidase family protein [Pseudomonadales bacterium]